MGCTFFVSCLGNLETWRCIAESDGSVPTDTAKLLLPADQVEDTLSSRSSGPYFLGDRFSLVDIMRHPQILEVQQVDKIMGNYLDTPVDIFDLPSAPGL